MTACRQHIFHAPSPDGIVLALSLSAGSIHPDPDHSFLEQNGRPYVPNTPVPTPDKPEHQTDKTLTAAPPDHRPIVVSGPSGVGKGTLYNLLFQRHPEAFCLSVSHTTRAPRDGEQDGVHYHFVPMESFEDLIAKDGFVEHAKFSGNRYGTSKMTIEEQTKKGKVVLLDIEMEVSPSVVLT